MKYGKASKPIRATIEWETYTKNFESIPREQLINSISGALLQLQPMFSSNIIKTFADNNSREGFIKSATLQLMSTPEYQMC